MTRKRDSRVRGETPVHERVVHVLQPSGADIAGGITAADEDSNPGIEESLDPIKVADHQTAIVECARGRDKCPHLPAKHRRRLVPHFIPVFGSRDKPSGVVGASPDERP